MKLLALIIFTKYCINCKSHGVNTAWKNSVTHKCNCLLIIYCQIWINVLVHKISPQSLQKWFSIKIIRRHFWILTRVSLSYLIFRAYDHMPIPSHLILFTIKRVTLRHQNNNTQWSLSQPTKTHYFQLTFLKMTYCPQERWHYITRSGNFFLNIDSN